MGDIVMIYLLYNGRDIMYTGRIHPMTTVPISEYDVQLIKAGVRNLYKLACTGGCKSREDAIMHAKWVNLMTYIDAASKHLNIAVRRCPAASFPSIIEGILQADDTRVEVIKVLISISWRLSDICVAAGHGSAAL